MIGVDFHLQVLHERSVGIPELAREYVVPVVGVDEDEIILIAVLHDEILSVCYVEGNAVVDASP